MAISTLFRAISKDRQTFSYSNSLEESKAESKAKSKAESKAEFKPEFLFSRPPAGRPAAAAAGKIEKN